MNRDSSASNKPLSLSFNFGITSNAMNERVMRGALNEDPNAFAIESISLYLVATME